MSEARCFDKDLMVKCSNNLATDIGRLRSISSSFCTRTIREESPPISKKLSMTSMRPWPRAEDQMARICLSRSVMDSFEELAGLESEVTGSGRAFRSILPLSVVGNVFTSTKKAGTMYAGNRAARNGRKRPARGC